MHPNLDRKQELLLREAAMASMSIGVGLTQLRRYDFTSKGYFYHALASLAMGLERVFKLILIYDYRLQHRNKFPTKHELKSFGHRLHDMVAAVLSINKRRALGVDVDFYGQDPLLPKIVAFLSEYAQTTRYYNLDSVAGATLPGDEPLATWDREIGTEIVKRHFRVTKNVAFMRAIAPHMDSFSVFSHSSEQMGPIKMASEMVAASETSEVKQKYSMYYAYMIVRMASQLLDAIECKGRFFPFLSEHFMIFRIIERNMIMRKKEWNPLPPYRF